MASYTLADIDAAIAAKSAPTQGPTLADIDAAIAAKSGQSSRAAQSSTPQYSGGQTALEHFGNGAALGYLPQLSALGEKVTYPIFNAVGDAANWVRGKSATPDIQADDYVAARDRTAKRLSDEAQQHPYIATGSEIGGGLATGIATSGLFAPAAEAGAAKTAVSVAKPLATKIGEGVLTGAKTGAVIGAVSNPGETQGEISPLQLGARAQNAYQSAKTGAFIGGAIPVAVKGFNSAAPAAQTTAQKIGKLFYVPEEATAAYLDNPDAINNAPSREDISNRVLALKENAQNQVEKATQDLQNAKDEALSTKYDTRAGLQDEKFSTQQSAQDAQQAYNEKRQALREALQKSTLTGLSGDVQDAIQGLKSKVVQGSSDAYDILENSKGNVQTAPLISQLDGHIKPLLVNGVPVSKSAAQAIGEIQEMQSRLSQMGEKISLPQAKQILQGLDKDIAWPNSAGEFSPQADQAMQGLRRSIDQSVKSQVPEYAQKMSEVSRQTKLLGAANDSFGTPEKAISNLNNVDSERGQAVHVPLLNQLEQETGVKLNPQVTDYLIKQKLLSSPRLFDQYMEQFPEAKALRQTQVEKQRLQDPSYSRSVSESSSMPAQQQVLQRQAMLDKARERAQMFNGVTPQSITSKTKALNGANQYGAQATFGPIDQAYGTNFQNEIRARNMADAFTKDATRGSRFVNMGRAVGAAGGAAIGGVPGAVIGQGIGATVGGAADVYGPQMFKKSLDAGMALGRGVNRVGNAVSGNAGAIMSSANGGANGLRLVPSAPMPAAATNDQQAPGKGPDKWANDGLQNLKGHISDDDRKFLDDHKGAMLIDPNAKQLLITASNYQPGSKPLDDIMKHLKRKFGEK